MRLWSLHTSYLDSKGIVALWREALLAKSVLEEKTKGYRNHPQLTHFKNTGDPLSAINSYLLSIWNESLKRSYKFDESKIGKISFMPELTVSTGQLKFELEHLKKKLFVRNKKMFNKIHSLINPKPNPLFRVIKGGIEEWEKL